MKKRTNGGIQLGARTAPLTPTDKRRLWERQVLSIWKTITKIESHQSTQGQKWVEGMVRHYRAELETLYDNEPKMPRAYKTLLTRENMRGTTISITPKHKR